MLIIDFILTGVPEEKAGVISGLRYDIFDALMAVAATDFQIIPGEDNVRMVFECATVSKNDWDTLIRQLIEKHGLTDYADPTKIIGGSEKP